MVYDPETELNFPLMQKDVLAGLFGEPSEDPASEFVKGYMRVCDLTQYSAELAHVRDYNGNPWGHKIYCNYILIKPLQKAFSMIMSRGLAGELQTFDGCFNVRQSKGGNFLSMHAPALAVDFNADANGYGTEPTMSPGLVDCFTAAGFEWGGLWRGRGGANDYSGCDGMHFQLPLIRYPRTGGPNYENGLPWVT